MADELKLATAGDDIKLWNVESSSITDQYNPHSSGISDICWSHNNQLIASTSTCSDKVVLSFVKTKASPVIQVAENSKPTCVTLNSNSRYLASAGKNQLVQVWDTKSCKLKKTYKGHQDTVNCVRFNWNDTYLASGSANGEIYLHNVISGVAIKPLIMPGTQSIQQLGYSYFKKALLASVSDDGALNLWDTNTSKSVANFNDSHRAPATALSFSPVNDMLLASAGLDKRIVCYSVQAKSTIKTITADAPLTSMAFASDGATLAAGTTRGKVLVYDLRMGALPIRTLNAHKTSVQAVAFSKVLSNKNESSDLKMTSAPTSRSKLIAGEPQVTSAIKNGVKPGKQLPKDIPPNGPTSRQPPIDKDQSSDALFSPVRDGTILPSRDSLSNDLSTRPEVLGKASTPRNDSLGGLFSPLADTMPHARGNPVGSVSMSPTTYQPNQPITSDLTPVSAGVTSGPSTPTGMSPRSRNVGSSPRHARRSPGRSSTGSIDLDTTQFKTNNQNRVDSPKLEEATSRPSVTDVSSDVENLQLDDKSKPAMTTFSNIVANTKREESSSRPTSVSSKVKNSKGDEIFTRPGMASRDEHLQQQEAPSRFGITNSIADESKNAISTRFSSDPHVPSVPYSAAPPNASGSGGDDGIEAAAQSTTQSTNLPSGGFQSFQVDFIKNIIDDSLEEFRDSIHRDIRNLQVEMLRQFQIQKHQMQEMLEKYSVNEGLLNEIERLKEENKRLKTKY